MERAVLETSSDRYVIVEYLAEGGMGAIYLGKKLGVGGFEKEVVLKQLLPEFTREPKFIDLFLREARLSASLEHANIVRTIDLVNAGSDYFMVMEYVRGADLRTLLKRARRRHQRLSVQVGIFICHEILEALAYAHSKTAHDGRPLSLIHRDISPSNILLSGAGEVKLTDFGIAKASTHRSVFYKVKGKVGYMSPEQARGQAVDARSDLFSLGVVLYEVLMGERLYLGDLMSTAAQIYAQPVRAPSTRRPEIPAELDAVILKALSLDPDGRFQSAEEFQEALTRVAARFRLLVGASEMAAQLRQAAGEDASLWLKPETAGFDRTDPTQQHGTAVLSTLAHDDEDEDEIDRDAPGAFDLSDGQEADAAARYSRPISLSGRELTSVIALQQRQREAEVIDVMRDDPPLSPLQPHVSEPVFTAVPSAPPWRPSDASARAFAHDDVLPATLVRQPAPTRRTAAPEDETRLHAQAAAPPPATPTGPQALDGTRRLPASGIRTRPVFADAATVAARPRHSRRWIVVVAGLALVGVTVAVVVAFSGPELDVVDPVPPAPNRAAALAPGAGPTSSAPSAPAAEPAAMPNLPNLPSTQGTAAAAPPSDPASAATALSVDPASASAGAGAAAAEPRAVTTPATASSSSPTSAPSPARAAAPQPTTEPLRAAPASTPARPHASDALRRRVPSRLGTRGARRR